MNRSTYSVTSVPGFICVIDENRGGMSVTNDVERVIAALGKAGYDLNANRVIYRDSTGVWDEILVRDGKFADFRFLGKTTLEAAIAAAQERA